MCHQEAHQIPVPRVCTRAPPLTRSKSQSSTRKAGDQDTSAYTVETQKPSPSVRAGQEQTLLESQFPEASPESRPCRGQRSWPRWVSSSLHTSTLAATPLAPDAASSSAGWGWGAGLGSSRSRVLR